MWKWGMSKHSWMWEHMVMHAATKVTAMMPSVMRMMAVMVVTSMMMML
jgi:hypothetical protein